MRPLALLALLALAGCSPTAPLREALPPLTTELAPVSVLVTYQGEGPAEAADETRTVVAAAPAPVYLYTRTDADLRLAFADALSGLLNAAVTPAALRRASPADARSWLDVLEGTHPSAAAFVRGRLGPALAEPALVAYVASGTSSASCSRMAETLFIAVPERHQGPERPYVGFVAHDACEGTGAFCLRCTSVGGAPSGEARPRVCTLARCGR